MNERKLLFATEAVNGAIEAITIAHEADDGPELVKLRVVLATGLTAILVSAKALLEVSDLRIVVDAPATVGWLLLLT